MSRKWSPSNVPWPVVAAVIIVSLVGIIYWWDRLVFGIELVEIRKAFGFSLGTAGFLSSIFVLGLAIIALPAGLILLRLGAHWGLVLGAAVFSLATLYTVIARGFIDLTLIRIISGIGEGIFNVAVYTYLGSLTVRYRGMAIGAFTGVVLGLAALTGPIAVAWMVTSTHDWRVPFLVLGLLGILGVFAIIAVRSSVKKSVEQSLAIPGGGGGVAARPPLLASLRCFMKPWFVPVAASMLVAGYATYATISLFVTFLRTEHHMTIGLAAFIYGFYGLGQLIFGAPAGYLGDRFGRKPFLIVSLIGTAVTWTGAFVVPPSVPLLCLLTFGAGFLHVGIYNQCYALAQDFVEPALKPVSTGAVAVVFFVSGAFSAPALVAAETALGWQPAAWLTFALPNFVCVFLTLALLRAKPLGVEPVTSVEVT